MPAVSHPPHTLPGRYRRPEYARYRLRAQRPCPPHHARRDPRQDTSEHAEELGGDRKDPHEYLRRVGSFNPRCGRNLLRPVSRWAKDRRDKTLEHDDQGPCVQCLLSSRRGCRGCRQQVATSNRPGVYCSLPVFGGSVRVSHAGLDTNPCGETAPCLTFNRAYRAAQPGQVVDVAAGVYPGQTINRDPTKTSPR